MTIVAVILAVDPDARITADPAEPRYCPLLCIENLRLGRRIWASSMYSANLASLKLYYATEWQNDTLRE